MWDLSHLGLGVALGGSAQSHLGAAPSLSPPTQPKVRPPCQGATALPMQPSLHSSWAPPSLGQAALRKQWLCRAGSWVWVCPLPARLTAPTLST